MPIVPSTQPEPEPVPPPLLEPDPAQPPMPTQPVQQPQVIYVPVPAQPSSSADATRKTLVVILSILAICLGGPILCWTGTLIFGGLGSLLGP